MENSTSVQNAKLKQKSAGKLTTEENLINLIKNSYQMSTAHVILKVGKLEPSPLRSGAGQGCALYTLVFKFL